MAEKQKREVGLEVGGGTEGKGLNSGVGGDYVQRNCTSVY